MGCIENVLNFLYAVTFFTSDDVFLGNDYELLVKSNDSEICQLNDIIYFLGYSGWGPLQLEHELQIKSWVTLKAKEEIIFNKNPEKIWRQALESKGGIYQFFANNVENPGLN